MATIIESLDKENDLKLWGCLDEDPPFKEVRGSTEHRAMELCSVGVRLCGRPVSAFRETAWPHLGVLSLRVRSSGSQSARRRAAECRHP